MDNNHFDYLIFTIWLCIPHLHDVSNVIRYMWGWLYSCKGRFQHKRHI